jgi:hypothetical protein
MTNRIELLEQQELLGEHAEEYALERLLALRQMLMVRTLACGVAVNELPRRDPAAARFHDRLRKAQHQLDRHLKEEGLL